jgi:hypothetical protein
MHRSVGSRVALLWLPLALSLACNTVVRPTKPRSAIAPVVGTSVPVRFTAENVSIREPGMPVSPSRMWLREVQNFTAETLNTLVRAPEAGPSSTTVVTFDLASPSALQIGTWKEMTISLQTTLANGRVVKSEPVTANIDDTVEYAVVTGMGVGGTVLDVAAAVASVVWVFQRTPESQLTVGVVFLGALLGGVALNVGQQGAQTIVAGQEETRWSEMYLQALTAHAQQLRTEALLPSPSPPPSLPTPPAPPPPPTNAPPGVLDPSDAETPPPPPPTPAPVAP